MYRPSFRAQVLRAREDAIVDTVNGLLAEKGFGAMTVDLVDDNRALAENLCRAEQFRTFLSPTRAPCWTRGRVQPRQGRA